MWWLVCGNGALLSSSFCLSFPEHPLLLLLLLVVFRVQEGADGGGGDGSENSLKIIIYELRVEVGVGDERGGHGLTAAVLLLGGGASEDEEEAKENVRYCWQSGKAHVNLLQHLT